MNPAALTRHYDALTPWARLPLLLAAAARADDVESARLSQSAPKQKLQAPDYWQLLDGFEGLVKLYLLQQLDGAAFFWRLLGALEQDLLFEAERHRQREGRIWMLIKLEAHRIVVRADGWKLFCQELQVDAEILLQKLPDSANLAHTEHQARLPAFTAEEAVAYLGEQFERFQAAPGSDAPSIPCEYRLETPADVAQAMRETLHQHLNEW
jgi:hypothetical protein